MIRCGNGRCRNGARRGGPRETEGAPVSAQTPGGRQFCERRRGVTPTMDRTNASANKLKFKAAAGVGPDGEFFGPESARASEDRAVICAMQQAVAASRARNSGGLNELDQLVVPTQGGRCDAESA